MILFFIIAAFCAVGAIVCFVQALNLLGEASTQYNTLDFIFAQPTEDGVIYFGIGVICLVFAAGFFIAPFLDRADKLRQERQKIEQERMRAEQEERDRQRWDRRPDD